MRPGRPSYGEVIAGFSAIVLYVSTTFDWFGVFCENHQNLLFLLVCVQPAKNAWEALDYIPSILLLAVFAALVTVTIRLVNPAPKLLQADAAVAVLGLVSTTLILFRIIDPPTFGTVTTGVTEVGTVQFPIYLALAAAAGVTIGGCLAMREEGFSFSKPGGAR